MPYRPASGGPSATSTVNPGLMTIIPNKGAGVMGAPVILVPGQGGADANQK
jgi:hypothetical protein